MLSLLNLKESRFVSVLIVNHHLMNIEFSCSKANLEPLPNFLTLLPVKGLRN